MFLGAAFELWVGFFGFVLLFGKWFFNHVFALICFENVFFNDEIVYIGVNGYCFLVNDNVRKK